MSDANLKQENFVIPAIDKAGTPGIYPMDVGGGYLFIVAASGQFKIRFDGGTEILVRGANYKWKRNFSKLTFFNYSTSPISMLVETGDGTVDYEGANEAKVAATYSRGNFGIKDAATLAAFGAGYISGVTKGSPGSNYVIGDVLTANGGTLISGGQAAKIRVDNVDHHGSITAYTLLQGGQYSVLPSSPNTPTGGSGSGATFNLTTVAAGGGLSLNADGSLTLAAGNSISLTGFDGANRRKQITLGVYSGSLIKRDANGCRGRKITTTEAYETSAAYIIDGGGASVTFDIDEIFYAQT